MSYDNRNAFEKRISESNSIPKNSFVHFMEKNGIMVGGASLALGVLMMGGSFLSNSAVLKAELTETPLSTPLVQNEEILQNSAVQTIPPSIENTANTNTVAPSASPSATSAAAEQINSSVSNTTDSTSYSTTITESYADPIVQNTAIQTPELPVAITAPAPVSAVYVPAEVISLDVSKIEVASEIVEVLPAEAIGDMK